MNLLLRIVIICGVALSTYAAPQSGSNQSSDLNIRNRRRVPASSYTRTEEGVQVAIPGLDETTDIITTTDTITEEGVTAIDNTEVNNSLTDVKVPSSEKTPSTTSSHKGDSGVTLDTSSSTPDKTTTVSNVPSVSQSTVAPNKKGQGSIFNKGPLGLPIPNPFSGLKFQPKLPAIPTGIPNIFGR